MPSIKRSLGITVQKVPKQLNCVAGSDYRETTPSLTHILEDIAQYWNTARKLANEKVGRTETIPLIKVVTNPDEVDEFTVRIGICPNSPSLAGLALENLIIINEKFIGNCVVIHEVGHRLGFFHASSPQKSVMLSGIDFQKVFQNLTCNLNVTTPLPYDVELAENVEVVPFMNLPESSEYRLVVEENYTIPPCRLKLNTTTDDYDIWKQLSQESHQLRQTGIRLDSFLEFPRLMRFLCTHYYDKLKDTLFYACLSGIVNTILEKPAVKSLPHYNLLAPFVRTTPHILLTIALLNASPTLLSTGIGTLALSSMITRLLTDYDLIEFLNTSKFEEKVLNLMLKPPLHLLSFATLFSHELYYGFFFHKVFSSVMAASLMTLVTGISSILTDWAIYGGKQGIDIGEKCFRYASDRFNHFITPPYQGHISIQME